ncbi:DUF1661 domain-containing protein [Porphyromonas gingivalis]|uniref:DUF1661 domain-containing protein n=2 Tax=Porphyromonas gingivalis TaxID=837 RepID=UPI001181BC49
MSDIHALKISRRGRMLVYVDESCVGFTNRNRCNCGARILKKWNVNYFVLVRDFFCSRTKIKKFSRHVTCTEKS